MTHPFSKFVQGVNVKSSQQNVFLHVLINFLLQLRSKELKHVWNPDQDVFLFLHEIVNGSKWKSK